MNRPDVLFCTMRCYSNRLLSIVAAVSSPAFLKLGGGMFHFIPHYSSQHFHYLNT